MINFIVSPPVEAATTTADMDTKRGFATRPARRAYVIGDQPKD
jgi:hypothetical protein